MSELDVYRTRRNFEGSPEPPGRGSGARSGADRAGRGSGARSGRAPSARQLFVVQEHAASSHHFDVRLEVGEVLVSWAVPKGPSTDPRDRRLAVRTEDHPRSYADFEGAIPPEEYGGGKVIVWDIGPFRNLTSDDDGNEITPADAIEQGHITVWLEGEKLRGGYALTQTNMRGDERNWILVKIDDDAADARRNPTSTEPKSVLSGRTVGEIGDDEAADGG